MYNDNLNACVLFSKTGLKTWKSYFKKSISMGMKNDWRILNTLHDKLHVTLALAATRVFSCFPTP